MQTDMQTPGRNQDRTAGHETRSSRVEIPASFSLNATTGHQRRRRPTHFEPDGAEAQSSQSLGVERAVSILVLSQLLL